MIGNLQRGDAARTQAYWVALKACGCLVAAAVDDENPTPFRARQIVAMRREWEEAGWTVKRITGPIPTDSCWKCVVASWGPHWTQDRVWGW